jgi:hypothetical protein
MRLYPEIPPLKQTLLFLRHCPFHVTLQVFLILSNNTRNSPEPFMVHSDPDFPEQECPEYGHNQGETPDNCTTDQRINL